MTEHNYLTKLYHFCKLETAIGLILPEKQLLIGKIKNTNDPRENREFAFGKKFKTAEGSKYKDSEISKLLLEDCKVMCFTQPFGIKPGFEHSNMWAHYGGNHKGVCIEIDTELFKAENKVIIDNSYFEKVKYEKYTSKNLQKNVERQFNEIRSDKIGLKEYIREFRKKHHRSLYFTKYEEWKYEGEKRLIYFSSTEDKEYCSIKKSITGVYLGIDFEESYRPAIKKLCEGIFVSKLKYGLSGRLMPECGHWGR